VCTHAYARGALVRGVLAARRLGEVGVASSAFFMAYHGLCLSFLILCRGVVLGLLCLFALCGSDLKFGFVFLVTPETNDMPALHGLSSPMSGQLTGADPIAGADCGQFVGSACERSSMSVEFGSGRGLTATVVGPCHTFGPETNFSQAKLFDNEPNHPVRTSQPPFSSKPSSRSTAATAAP
jgi:hypothetical protein